MVTGNAVLYHMVHQNVGQMEQVRLDEQCFVLKGSIPQQVLPNDFNAVWDLRPTEQNSVVVYGKRFKSPRWSCSYERDYAYSQQVSRASKLPSILEPLLRWCQSEMHKGYNGVLLNWHDGALGHYHAKHRDSTKGLVHGTSIVTISLGEERVFRLRPYGRAGERVDVFLRNGDFVVIPWETNEKWTHEIPKLKRYNAQRVSVTIRAFQ